MESAIPPALRCPRLNDRRIADDYTPPFPAWTAAGETQSTPTVMAYLGVQAGSGNARAALDAVDEIAGSLSSPSGPVHHDLAHFNDDLGFENYVITAFWSDITAFDTWRDRVSAWWDSSDREVGPIGFFREVFTPTSDRFETLFSSERLEGVGATIGQLWGPVQEHGYWGSMRDRLPLAQTDQLHHADDLFVRRVAPGRISVIGHHNLALIRSGQDWSETHGEERVLYLEKMEPILREGMTFLSREGSTVGCYSNRYATMIDQDGSPLQRSFGLSQWRSLRDMERWSESHPTHVRIFGTFMEIVQTLAGHVDLRLYHEVSVLRSEQQFYEYINCHESTGLMVSVEASA